MPKFTTTFSHENAELDIEYSATSGSPATFFDPAEEPEIELISVTFMGAAFELTDEETDALLDHLYENLSDTFADAAADYGDYLYDRMKDERNEEI